MRRVQLKPGNFCPENLRRSRAVVKAVEHGDAKPEILKKGNL
jgi:hypothetical protein